METPSKKGRKRKYVWKDFALEELDSKIGVNKQRIVSKEQQNWEQEIVLNEENDKIRFRKDEISTDNSKMEKN
jgi:hypothetical protein